MAHKHAKRNIKVYDITSNDIAWYTITEHYSIGKFFSKTINERNV